MKSLKARWTEIQEIRGMTQKEDLLEIFFCGRRPLPFGGSHLRLPSGPAGIRTTTGSLSALARPTKEDLLEIDTFVTARGTLDRLPHRPEQAKDTRDHPKAPQETTGERGLDPSHHLRRYPSRGA